MPLELTDFDQAGLEVDALALIVAAAPPNVYADADRGGTQTPEGGDIGIGAGETRISRISILYSGARVRLNDNDNPVELLLREHFGQSSQTSKWRLYIQTDDGVAWSQQLGNTGGGFANFDFGVAEATVLDSIAEGDRFLVALGRRLLPVGATLPGEAGSVAAAVAKHEDAANKQVAATLPAAAATLATALAKHLPGVKPVAAVFAGAEGSFAAALTRQSGAAKPIAADFAGAAATLATALAKHLPGVKPVALGFGCPAGGLSAALARRDAARKPLAAQFDGMAGSLDPVVVAVLAALLAPERFLEAIAADLRTQLPALRTCQVHDGGWDLGELKRWSVGAPAMLVAWLGTERTEAPGLAWTDCDQQLAVYVVTADGRDRSDAKLLRRGAALRNLVNWLLLYIPRARWNVRGIGAAENLRARNLYSRALDKAGAALAEVSWRQTVRLEIGEDMDCPELPAELYAAAQQEPHEQLYPEVA